MKINRHLPILFILACTIVVSAQEKLNLMPVPASITFHNERLPVDSNFRVATRGYSDARLQAAISRFMKRLEGRTVLTLDSTLAPDDQTTPLIIQTQGAGKNTPG